MKKSIVTMLVLAWLLCAFVAADILLPKCHGKSTGDKRLESADNGLEIGKYGNLLKWPGTRFHSEGYELYYEYTHPRTGKKVVNQAYALGNEPARGLSVGSDNKSSRANIKEVSVRTEDGVLTLTRLFTLNEKLEAKLIIRNNSGHKVSLRRVIFRISVGEQSVRNDSRHPVRTPLQSHYLLGPMDQLVCAPDGHNCIEPGDLAIDCTGGGCPPP